MGGAQAWQTLGGSEARLRHQQRRLRKQHRTRERGIASNRRIG
jgi:hypothetical protein